MTETPSSYQACMQAILDAPEDDAPQRALAEIVRPTDPVWARLITKQLDYVVDKRAKLGRPGPPDWLLDLVSDNKRRLTEDLRFYLGELPQYPRVDFYRGLPWLCSMTPHTFLEAGAYICTRVAPLRGVEFCVDPEGAPFPAKELAASPLLGRFEHIGFNHDMLGRDDLAILASSPHLERLLTIDVRENRVSAAAWEAMAANPLTRKCLWIASTYEVPSDEGPIGEFSAMFDVYPTRFFEMSAEGRALESRYGYLPWLHMQNSCSAVDAHYWVEQKMLPWFVPGSDAEAPTPFGTGLARPHALEPRERFCKLSFDSVW